ncbi:hypothetical protein [uncultured Winogradskyella sp.]|uniref:hypothetical protein n=1 Tax=uncultured Winogradskyella sp. TaxID=395353 RepID=UPI0026075EEC|nr:hypothetical protein [uncultured Winogradskyella sp.]
MTKNGLLVWYPKLECFGCFDEEDGYYFALKNISWETLKANTFTYLVGPFEWDEGWEYILNPVEEDFEFIPDEKKPTTYPSNPHFSFIHKKVTQGLCLLKDGEGKGIIALTDRKYNIHTIIENKEKREVNGLRVVELMDNGTIKYKTDFNNIRKVTIASTDRKKAKNHTKKYPEYSVLSIGNYSNEQAYNYILHVLKQNDYEFDRYFMSSLRMNSPHKEILRNIDFSGVMRLKEISRIYTIHNQNAQYTVYTDEKNQIHHVLDEEGLPIAVNYQVLAVYDDNNDQYKTHEDILSEKALVVIARCTKNQYGYRPFSKDLQFTVLKSQDKASSRFTLPSFPNLHNMGVNVQETDPNKAITYLQRALTFSSRDYYHYAVYIDLGVAYKTRSSNVKYSVEDQRMAYKMYQIANSLTKDNTNHHFAYFANMGVVCNYLDKNEEGLKLLNQGIELGKGLRYLKPIKALFDIKCGNYKAGIDYIEKHTDINNNVDNEIVVDAFFLAYGYSKLKNSTKKNRYLEYVRNNLDCLTDNDDIELYKKMLVEMD